MDTLKHIPTENDGPLGDELAPDARIWREYTEEAANHDAALVENLNRTCDLILVFVGCPRIVIAKQHYTDGDVRSYRPPYSPPSSQLS